MIGAGLATAGLMLGPAAAANGRTSPRIRRLSPRFDRIIAPDAPIRTIASRIRWAEGPLWIERGGYLLFSDPPANVVRQWRPGATATRFLAPSGLADADPRLVREAGANGLALDRDGALLIANSGAGSIDRVDLATRRRSVLIAGHRGARFNSPNDLCVARDGAIYFTDPPYGLTDGDRSPLKRQPCNGVYRWRPGGETILLDATLTRPNGIALSPDERRLYVSVSDEAAPRILAYDLDSRGLPRGDPAILLDAAPLRAGGAPGLPDGMKVARDGTLVCSAPGGILFLTPEGERLGVIGNGAPMANCAFGERGRALFIAADDRILRVPLRPGWQG